MCEMQLVHGDRLLPYTDGVIESRSPEHQGDQLQDDAGLVLLEWRTGGTRRRHGTRPDVL